ncbi:MAG: thioredoxin domain-containing protein [Bacteroidales bacterium]|jgi:thioredoxin 1
MTKSRLSIKFRQVLSWLFIVGSVLLLVSLFAFKDKLTGFSSKLMLAQADPQTINTEARRIDSAYNYSKNGLPYQFTFLEFGAKGCSACKRMEGVMEEIKTAYTNRVNVNFINVRLPENQKIMEYFGVVVIPTQVLLDKDGKEYFRHSGFFAAEDLTKHF